MDHSMQIHPQIEAEYLRAENERLKQANADIKRMIRARTSHTLRECEKRKARRDRWVNAKKRIQAVLEDLRIAWNELPVVWAGLPENVRGFLRIFAICVSLMSLCRLEVWIIAKLMGA